MYTAYNVHVIVTNKEAILLRFYGKNANLSAYFIHIYIFGSIFLSFLKTIYFSGGALLLNSKSGKNFIPRHGIV